MDARVWQRYVAAACGHAWKLDAQDTEEVLRCIEVLLAAAPITGLATVQVLLGTGVGVLTVEGGAEGVRIWIRSQVDASGESSRESHPRSPMPSRSGR
jgi:hypothetical protein